MIIQIFFELIVQFAFSLEVDQPSGGMNRNDFFRNGFDFFQDFISLFVLDKILDLKKSGKLNVVKLTKFRDNLLSEKLCRKMSFCMDVIISDLSKGQVA